MCLHSMEVGDYFGKDYVAFMKEEKEDKPRCYRSFARLAKQAGG